MCVFLCQYINAIDDFIFSQYCKYCVKISCNLDKVIPHLMWFCYIAKKFNEDAMQVAVQGYGNMGKVHADNFSLMDQHVSVIEIDEERRQQAGEKGYPAFPSLSELLQNRQIDCIAICTPTSGHYKQIKEALSHNLAVFVEKPIVLTAGQVHKLREIMGQHLIFVGEVEQYNPSLNSALSSCEAPIKILIDRKVNLKYFIGDSLPWFTDEEQSGGVPLDLMIHDITRLILQFGIPSIGKVSARKVQYPCPDDVEVELIYEGFSAYLRAHWLSKSSKYPIKVKWCVFDADHHPHTTVCKDYLNSDKPIEDSPYYIQDHAFIGAVKTGSSPYPTESYLQAVEIACKINEMIAGSSKT